jgi:hypothetical protein
MSDVLDEELECDAELWKGEVYFGDAPDFQEVDHCEEIAVVSVEIPGSLERRFACEKHRVHLTTWIAKRYK